MHGNLTNFHDRKDDCCVRMLWTFPGWFPSTLPRIRGSKVGVEKKLRHLPKNDCQIPKMIQNNSNDQVMKSNMWKLSLEVASSVEWPNQSIQMQILGAFGMQIHHFGMWSMAWPIPSMALIYIYTCICVFLIYIYTHCFTYFCLISMVNIQVNTYHSHGIAVGPPTNTGRKRQWQTCQHVLRLAPCGGRLSPGKLHLSHLAMPMLNL